MAPRTNVSIREPAVHRIADTPLGDTIANIAHDTRYIMTCTSHHSEVSALLSCVLLHIVAVVACRAVPSVSGSGYAMTSFTMPWRIFLNV